MKRFTKHASAALVLTGAVVLGGGAGAAYAATSQYFGGNLNPNHIVQESTWHTVSGGIIDTWLTGSAGIQFGNATIRTLNSSGVQWSAQGNGHGTELTHLNVSNGWSQCFWVSNGSGSTPSSVPVVCKSKSP